MSLDNVVGILAEDNAFDIFGLVIFAVVVGLSVLGSVIGKIKQAQEKAKRQAEQQQRPAPRPQQQPGPRQQQAAEPEPDVVAALRQALGWEGPAPSRPPPPLPQHGARTSRPAAPPARPIRQPKPRPRDLDVVPMMAHHETVADHHLETPLDRMDAEGPVRNVGSLGHAAETASAPHHLAGLPVSDPADLRRGIVYAEVLGQPKALRTGPERWDV